MTKRIIIIALLMLATAGIINALVTAIAAARHEGRTGTATSAPLGRSP